MKRKDVLPGSIQEGACRDQTRQHRCGQSTAQVKPSTLSKAFTALLMGTYNPEVTQHIVLILSRSKMPERRGSGGCLGFERKASIRDAMLAPCALTD